MTSAAASATHDVNGVTLAHGDRRPTSSPSVRRPVVLLGFLETLPDARG